MGESSDDRQEFRIVDKNGVHDPDDSNKIKNVIAAAKEDTEVFPLLSSFNPQNQSFDPAIGAVVLDNAKRQILRQQIMAFFKGEPQYPRPFAGS